jgi:hypothetical protein
MKICPECKKSFVPSKYHPDHLHCSPACRTRAWKRENPEKKRENNAKWAKKHADVHAKHSAKYYEANKDDPRIKEQRLHQVIRRKKRIQSLPRNLTLRDWKAALDYFENKCAYCRAPLTKAHREHFVPVTAGGGFTKDNIVPACQKCNLSKRAKNPIEWLASQVWGLIAYARVTTYLESQRERGF